jgi:hypothetical protein
MGDHDDGPAAERLDEVVQDLPLGLGVDRGE